jgi:lipoyl(octanoyl) transferase/dATP pyrophosphohydrolase
MRHTELLEPLLRRPYSVQVFLTQVSSGVRHYLILQRMERLDLALPAFYQGVSGALEGHETFAQGAIREVREETALRVDMPLDVGFSHWYLVKEQWRAHYGSEPTYVEERVFTADVSGQPDPVLSFEHTGWQWLTFTRALAVLTYGENAECLRRVEQYWCTRSVDAGAE